MSAGKLSRLTGLVLVLAAFAGGASAGAPGALHETGGLGSWANGNTSNLAVAVSGGISYLATDFDWG